MFDQQAKERYAATVGRPSKSVEHLPPINDKAKARDQAGKAFGVSGKLVDQARVVRQHGTPELVKAVEEGRVAVTYAAVLAHEPPDVQHEELSKPGRNRTYSSLAKTPAVRGGDKVEAKLAPVCKAAKSLCDLTRKPFSQISIVELRDAADVLMAALVKATGAPMEEW